MRNQRGQVQQAATAKARAAEARAALPEGEDEDASTTGAFGQQSAEDDTPANRQERRAQSKRR